jgi:hypothetical protein
MDAALGERSLHLRRDVYICTTGFGVEKQFFTV